jgi:serine protease Do
MHKMLCRPDEVFARRVPKFKAMPDWVDLPPAPLPPSRDHTMSLPHSSRTRRWLAFLLFVSMVLPVAAGDPPAGSTRRNAIVSVVDKAKQSTVNILSERSAPTTYDRGLGGNVGGRTNGMGTGIVIDPRGYIVTNFHVVDEVTSLHVRLHNDVTKYEAEVIAKDKETDLAVIKINAGKLLPVTRLGTSSDLMVGETVIAIGNAFGYENTVSMGIISALGRDVTLNKEVSYKQLIQTNASINPGNSGGPLLNIDGELIGVNVAIRAGAQGISFAIPVDSMLETVSDLLARKRRVALPTGLQYRDRVDITQHPIRALVVEKVIPSSVAEKAGLKAGDVITTLNETAVESGLDFERALIDAKPGDKFAVKFRRGKEAQKLELAFEPRESLPANDPIWKSLGLKLAATEAETITRLYAHLHGGMLITDIDTRGPAAKAGLQPGDYLVGLHNWETVNFDNVHYVLNHESFSSFKPLQFHIIRKGQLHRGTFPKE